jgi:zinc transport system permease protein
VTGLLALGLMRRALAAGILVSAVSGALSPFIVLRRMSFVGHGVAHAAFGGVALGVLLGINPLLSGTVFSIGVALLIGVIGRKGHLSEDVSIGILFASAMAFGIVCLQLMKGYSVDLFGYLFGNLLMVSSGDLGMIAALAVGTVLLLVLLHREILFTTFDEEQARAVGLPATAIQTVLLVFLALTIVISIKIVGAVLIAALLVVPGASALQISSRYRTVFPASVGLGVAAAVGGLSTSYVADLAPGATVVLFSAGIFVVCLVLGRAWR